MKRNTYPVKTEEPTIKKMIRKPKVSVADVPHMLKMWDRERNKELPEDVYISCKDTKYWLCPDCGYDWPASPNARYKSSGKCPCHESNKVLKRGINDVLTRVKGLASFLDEDNDFEAIYKEGLDSSLPVNFKCDECGRKWTAIIRSQVKKDGNGGYIASGCPHYETSKRKKDEVPFCTEVESIIRFWDPNNPMDPAKTRSNSNDLAHFICKNCGYDWTTSIRAQTRGTGKCKCCELQLVTRKGFTDVFTLIPESKRFFDFEKNKDIDIYSIPLRDKKIKIDWKCPDCKREWRSYMADRVKGRKDNYSFVGCYDCYRRDKNYNTPVAAKPDLIKFWDFKKNRARGLDPNLTLVSSEEPADWRCKECGYEWVTKIVSRTHGTGNCPFCIRQANKNYNTPVTAKPDLIKYWDFEKNRTRGLDPNLTSAFSYEPADWRCKECGYEWETKIVSRTFSTGTCPHCQGYIKSIITDFNDALTLCPDLARIYDFDTNKKAGIDIYKESITSKKECHFKCQKCGHEWNSRLNVRVRKKADGTYRLVDCPECSDLKFRKTPYSVEFPLLAKMYRNDMNMTPLDSIRGSNSILKTYYHWECLVCGDIFPSTLNSMISSYKSPTHGCPYCSRTKLRPGESFADLHPELMDEYDPSNTIDPYKVFPNSKDSAKWICRDCGHHWDAIFTLRHTGGGICPVCNRTRVIPEKNSFAAVYPNDVKYWANSNERKADEVFYNATIRFNFICQVCNQEHSAYIRDFISGESCPFCKGIRLSPETNSLKVLYPNVARRWGHSNDFGPETVLPTSKTWAKWICDTCTSEYSAKVKDVVNGVDECPYCKGIWLSPEVNSLKALYPDIARRWGHNNDFGPETVLPTSWTWAKWICDTCTGEYNARVKDVVNGEDECPYCNDRLVLPGFNSFGDKHPDLIAEMDEVANYLLPKTPYDVLDASNYKFWFNCEKDPRHKYPMSPRERLMFQKRGRESCLYCRGQRRKLNRFMIV